MTKEQRLEKIEAKRKALTEKRERLQEKSTLVNIYKQYAESGRRRRTYRRNVPLNEAQEFCSRPDTCGDGWRYVWSID